MMQEILSFIAGTATGAIILWFMYRGDIFDYRAIKDTYKTLITENKDLRTKGLNTEDQISKISTALYKEKDVRENLKAQLEKTKAELEDFKTRWKVTSPRWQKTIRNKAERLSETGS